MPYPLLEFELYVGTWDTADLAYPDTAFDGGIIIPEGMGRELLAAPDLRPVRLADGHIHQVRAWTGTLILDDRRFQVEVVALGARYLLGREVLDQLEICFQFGREVRVRFQDDE